MRLARVAWLVGFVVVATGVDAAHLGLANVSLGASILDTVRSLGTPDVLQTTDNGHMWQWAEAGHLDREILTDDDLTIHQILIAPPAQEPGASPPPATQPSEAPILGLSVRDATKVMEGLGAQPLAEPESSVRAWRLGGGVLVAELEKSTVARLLALDEDAAHALGYLSPAKSSPVYRAPVLVKPFVPDLLWHGYGTVIVRVDVDAKGKVTDTRILVSSKNPSVDDWETQSMKRSTFRPAICGDTPCAGVYLDIGSMSR